MRASLRFVSTDFGQHVTAVDLNDSVSKVKIGLGFLWEVPSEHLKLFYKSQEIEDSRKLSYYGIRSDSVLNVRLLKATCRIIVIFPDGCARDFIVDLDWTVRELKQKVADRVQSIPPDQLNLLFEDMTLGYDQTLRSAGIAAGSYLQAIHSLKGC